MEDDSKSFRERLDDRFKATDFVRVINIDDEAFEWAYMPISHETSVIAGPVRRMNREPAIRYSLQPGESKVIEGASAAIMAEGLFKKICIKNGKLRDMSNPAAHNEYITKIVLGKEDLLAMANAPKLPVESDVADDLGLGDEPEFESAKRGRSRKAE